MTDVLGLLAAVFVITVGGIVHGLLVWNPALIYTAAVVLIAAVVGAVVERRRLDEYGARHRIGQDDQ